MNATARIMPVDVFASRSPRQVALRAKDGIENQQKRVSVDQVADEIIKSILDMEDE